MKMREGLKLEGRLQIFLNDEKVVDDRNLIVDTGRAWAAEMLGGNGQPVTSMKIGDNGAKPTVLDTALIGTVIAELPLTNPGGDVFGNSIEFAATAQVGVGVGGLQEVGLFSSGTVLVARKAFPLVNKGPTDVMSFIWTLTVI